MSFYKIEMFVYDGQSYRKAKHNEDYFAFNLIDRFQHYQCRKKPVEQVQGYGFCKAHAEEVKGRLGLLEASLKAWEISKFDLRVKEIDIVRHTDKRIYLLNGRSEATENTYTKIFLSKQEAIDWITQACIARIERAQAEIERWQKRLGELEGDV